MQGRFRVPTSQYYEPGRERAGSCRPRPRPPPGCPGTTFAGVRGRTNKHKSGGGRIRTSTGASPPPRWAASGNRNRLAAPVRAEDGVRTRDPHPGRVMLLQAELLPPTVARRAYTRGGLGVQVPKGISSSNPSGRYTAHRTGAVRFAGPLVPEARFPRKHPLGRWGPLCTLALRLRAVRVEFPARASAGTSVS